MTTLSELNREASVARPTDVDVEPVSERRLVARNGASVSVCASKDGERLEVRDHRDRLVFQLEPETGRTVMWAPDGDLSFRAAGDIDLVAKGTVRCRGDKEVSLEAGQGEARSKLTLGPRVAALTSQVLQLAADSAELALDEATLRSERLRAKVSDAKVTLTRLETITERLFEQAKSVFRTVEDLHQLKTGRSRTLVRDGYDLRAGYASIEAEAEVKIDGKAIHLG